MLTVLSGNLELRLKSCLIQSEDSFQAITPIKIIPEDFVKREDCIGAQDGNNFSCDLESNVGEC